MAISRLNKYYCVFVMLVAVLCIFQPVLADAGTVTISYRGSGGYYIGDTITFDGRDTIGNTTLVKITGPGLPAEGVPLYDLNGVPGSGNTATVNHDGSWKFIWYSSNTAGIEKLVTARYTITALDLSDPEKTAVTSILLKKPEFYINTPPGPVNPGDYVQLNGYAERGVTYVKIDVTDSNDTLLRTFISPVSGSGSFNYGFRSDMPPGRYVVSVSNPSMKNTLMTTLTVVPVGGDSGLITAKQENITPAYDTSFTQPPTIIPPITSPTPSLPLSSITAIAGLIISAAIILAGTTGRRK